MTPDERAFVQSLAAQVVTLAGVLAEICEFVEYPKYAAKSRLVGDDVLDALNELEGA